MAEFGELVVIYDLLPEMATKLDEALDALVRKAAFDIRAIAGAGAPVQTGFLKNSIYVETAHESDYSQTQPPQGHQALLPEMEKPKAHQAMVAVGASYGAFVEFGTVHQSAQPYLTPAAEIVRPQFLAALEKLEAEMALA